MMTTGMRAIQNGQAHSPVVTQTISWLRPKPPTATAKNRGAEYVCLVRPWKVQTQLPKYDTVQAVMKARAFDHRVRQAKAVVQGKRGCQVHQGGGNADDAEANGLSDHSPVLSTTASSETPTGKGMRPTRNRSKANI